MTRLPMSSAGASLLRSLLSRAAEHANRILLTDYRSTDWQSLTFVGERHELRFRLTCPDAEKVYDKITGDLSEAEFSIPKRLLADIAVFEKPVTGADGSISFGIEALTIDE